MKVAVILVALAIGVPMLAALAIYRDRIRDILFSLMIFSTSLGDRGNVNFWSIETYRGPDRGFEIALTDLLALALALAVIIRRPGRISWLPYNTLFLFVFFVISAYSAVDVSVPIYSWFTLFKMVRAFILYFVVVNLLRSGVPLTAVWRGILWIGVYLALTALRQKYFDGIYRIPATFDHSNTVPLYLNQVLPVLLAFGLAGPLSRARAIWSIGTAVAMLFTVVMTFSRAGMALSVLTILGTLWYANRKMRSTRVLAATGLVLVGLAMGGAVAGKSIVERFLEAPESSELARDEFNRVARAMASDYGMGVGINQFSQVLTVEPEYHRKLHVMGTEKAGGVCHHIYYLTAAELGWFGMGFFVLILLRFMYKPLRGAFIQPGFAGMVQWALFCGAIALHLSGFFEWVFRITPILYLFIICAGIAVGLADVHKKGWDSLESEFKGNSPAAPQAMAEARDV